MRRRDFIVGLGGALSWPLATQAQQRPAMPVVALFTTEPADTYAHREIAFRRTLSEAGFSEGRNVVIEHYSADGRNDACPPWRSIWSAGR
jgi:putative ABC transport system substrate-binding protein